MKTILLSSYLIVLPLVSCSSDDGSAPAPTASFALDTIVKDGPANDLSSFSLDITEIRLLNGAGDATDNLLGATRRVELLGLQTSGEWLFRAVPPQGTYAGARFVFDAGSVVARDLTGATVAVTVNASSIDSTFAEALEVGASGYERLVLDVELGDSVTGDVASPPLQFSPIVLSDASGTQAAIDEFEGVITALVAGGESFTMTAFADESLESTLGLITVDTDGTTEFLDDDDLRFPSRADFFAAVTPSSTRVEVHGEITSGGRVLASRIEVEDPAGSAPRVEIEGRLVDIAPGTSFDMLITEIEEGSQTADSVLGGLGNPAIITVNFDVSTVFRADDSGPFLSEADLAIGQEIEVRFNTFSSPFMANRVEIEGEAERYVDLTGISGLPSELTVQLRLGDPAIAAGLVTDENTDVAVDLSNAELFLDLDVPTILAPGDLVAGVTAEIQGSIAGSASAPTIAAIRVDVEPGSFEGFVSAADSQTSTFDATVVSIEEPMGGAAGTPPWTVSLEPGCVFTGGATTEAEFYALFAGLQPGQQLSVAVEGLGDSVPNAVRAFAIEVEVD